jgi:L-lysine 2,3-aminomutase
MSFAELEEMNTGRKPSKKLEIMEHLRGYTSGLAVPTYIVNAPYGNGKTPIAPNYMLEKKDNYILLRTWENKIIPYETP